MTHSPESVDKLIEFQGLTEQEVIEQRNRGLGNNAKLDSSRSYWQIIKENVFTFINMTFLAISIVFFLLKRYSDGFLVVVIIFGGVIVNIYQEIWAKQKLDEIALLNRPKATVIREGEEKHIDPTEIVVNDLIPLQTGDQILVDGKILGSGKVEVDESLLTGESDLIPKIEGDAVYSGSVCVSGQACYQAEKVGSETVAYRLTAGARSFRKILTPLQKEINLIIRVFFLIACFLWILILISFITKDHSLNDVVQRSAVIAGLVPAGLLITITLAYGLGAVGMLGQDVLIQQTNAVESLSNVDVLCLDKTGTLTTNQIKLEEIYPLDITKTELEGILGDYATNTTEKNKTAEALQEAFLGEPRTVVGEIPFNSARKWSAVAFDDQPRKGIYVLGAPEILSLNCSLSEEAQNYITSGAQKGLRVVLMLHSHELESWNPEETKLPSKLVPVGIIRFSDVLRDEAQETLKGFAKAGVKIKVISGDNPITVAALATQAGLNPQDKVISGPQLALMDNAQFSQAALNNKVFGRITPEQKAQLVKSLKDQGCYVAMTGDGVNDVLSLKQANMAIAMESGSKATRAVADIVLLKDSFGSLPKAFLEGQRIRNGILDAMKLFMVRNICVTLLIFAVSVVTDNFPLENKHSALVALLGVGFPTMVTPIWAKPGKLPSRSLVKSMLHFVLPAAFSFTLVSLVVYLFYLVVAVLNLPPGSDLSQINRNIPRTALVTILIMGQLFLLPFLKPPAKPWVGGEALSGDWRYTITALVLLSLYFVIVFVEPLRRFFELSQLSLNSYLFIGLIAIEWGLIVRFIWRSRFLDRFLGVDL